MPEVRFTENHKLMTTNALRILGAGSIGQPKVLIETLSLFVGLFMIRQEYTLGACFMKFKKTDLPGGLADVPFVPLVVNPADKSGKARKNHHTKKNSSLRRFFLVCAIFYD